MLKKIIHKTVHANPDKFLDMVIENAGIAISHIVKGEELRPVNSIQIVKKIKQTLINTFPMVFKFVFILNK